MRPNRVKQLWRDGKCAVGGWLSIPSIYSAEVMAHQGFDWLCIDTQHGMIDYSSAAPMLAAISTTDTMPFVRVPWNEPSIIMKYLDAGAYGIVVPLVNNRAEAEAAVAACRYPPKGIRSSGPNRANLYAGRDYQAHADDEVACIVMIETREAIDKIEDIVSTPGVDAAYIGPSDLSLALGLPPRADNEDPIHVGTVAAIREACEKYGVAPGIHCASSKFAAWKASEGFKMVMLTSDVAGVSSNASRMLAEMKGQTHTPDGSSPYG